MKIDQAIDAYIRLRDKKKQLTDAYKDSVEDINEKLKKLEAAFLKAFDASGQESAKTAAGTAYISKRTSAKVIDREAFVKFLEAGGNMDLIESKVSKTALEEFVEETGDLPPGVTMSTELTVNVRRK